VEDELDVETEPELDEGEKRLYRYLEPVLNDLGGIHKAKIIDMVEIVTDLFNVNEVQLTTNDVVGFVRTVREWDQSVGKLDQTDAESMYTNLNNLNIDSELFDILVHIHIKTVHGSFQTNFETTHGRGD